MYFDICLSEIKEKNSKKKIEDMNSFEVMMVCIYLTSNLSCWRREAKKKVIELDKHSGT